MSTTGEKYIYPNHDGYFIKKTIKGVSKYFGNFKTFEEALEHKNYCEANDWSSDCVNKLRRPYMNELRHLQRVNNSSKYRVCKKVGERYKYFGTFDSLVKAKAHRDYCEANGWSDACRVLSRKKHDLPRYITRSARGYLLQRNSKSTGLYQQCFKRLEDAVREKELLESVGWDEEKLWELDEIRGTL